MKINFNNVKKGRFLSKEEDISLLRIQEDEKFTAMIDKLTRSDKRLHESLENSDYKSDYYS